MPKELLNLTSESDEVCRIAVNNAPDAIFSIDESNRIILASLAAERIFGYQAAEMIGQPVGILMPEEFFVSLRRDFSQSAETGGQQNYRRKMKVSARRRGGAPLTLEISAAESFQNDERIFIIIVREVSEELFAETSRSESQAMLSLAVKSGGIGVWEQDLATDTVIWSAELEEIFGLKKGEFSRTTVDFYKFVHEDDRQFIWAEVQNAIAEKREYEIEFRFHHADGSVRWMVGRGQAFYAENGKPVRLYGIGVDITERKKAEEILRKSSRELNQMADAMPQVVWIADAKGVVNYYNSRVSAFYGGLGKPESGVWNWQPFVYEDDLDLTINAWDEAIKREIPYSVEHRIKMNDGQFRWHLSRAFPVRNDDGTIEKWFGTATDIDEVKRVGEALRESEERYRRLFNSIDEGFGICELLTDDYGKFIDYRFLEVNPAFEHLTGLTDATSKTMREMVPEIENYWLELYERVLQTGESERFTSPVAALNRWFEVFAFRVGKIEERKVAVLFTNITERHRIEETLRDSEKRFRHMADNAPVMIWVTNHDGYCSYLSQSWYEFTGQTPAEGLGFGWVNAVHPDEREYARESFVNSNKNQTAFNVEYRFRRSDGEYRWAIDSAQPRFSETGEYLGYIGSVVDIHDRKKAEEQIKYQLDLTETITDNTQSCLLMMDENGRGTFANHATERITGFKPEELIGEVLHEKIHHTHPDGTPFPIEECPLDNALPIQEAVVGYEDVFVHKNGSFYPVRCSGRPIFQNGKPIGTVIEVQDITEEKRIEAERTEILEREQTARMEAEAANRAKDEFLSVLSHELRTPLNAILGWTRMLKSGLLDEQKNLQAIETIERNARLQNNLIEDLLDVSRIISGKMRLETEKLNLTAIVHSALETVRPSAESKNISIDAQTAPETLEICGDPTRFQQIVVNLANNAVKFTPAGGSITVRLSKIDKRARLEISDTGVGISSELLPHIFDRFRQADSTTQRNHSGLGLGLTIVHHLVELHDGEVFASSDGMGKGATFTVNIPLLGESANKIDACQAEIPTNEDDTAYDNILRNKTILLVDDDCDGIQPLKLFLEMHGAEAVCIDSAFEALRAFGQRKFDLILSDIGMPETDGYEFIGQIRNLPENAAVPAIALTAYASADDRARAIAAGFQMHHAKPLNFEKLLQTVTEILNQNDQAQ